VQSHRPAVHAAGHMHHATVALRRDATSAAGSGSGGDVTLALAWVECVARQALVRSQTEPDFDTLRGCGAGVLEAGLRLPLVAELITEDVGSLAARRAALTALLDDSDANVRGAALGAVPALAKAGEDADRASAAASFEQALAASELSVVSAAIYAAPELYPQLSAADSAALDAALLARAETERDPEVGAGLLDLIAERVLPDGREICRAALTGHPVIASAAGRCLVALGETLPEREAVPGLPEPPVDLTAVIGRSLRWRLETTQGEIVIALRADVAPWTVATIAALSRQGFYDGVAFHRVVPNFVVQGGDPTESGYGGPGFSLPTEPAAVADGTGFARGGIGLADAGRDSGGSQWFATHTRTPHLDARYTWFGRVERGSQVIDALLQGDRILHASIE
ncbi:MAG: peptidylprolyl isomerase, partial [Polyangiales bacterium]